MNKIKISVIKYSSILLLFLTANHVQAQVENEKEAFSRYMPLKNYAKEVRTESSKTGIIRKRIEKARKANGQNIDALDVPLTPNPFLSNAPKPGNYLQWSNYMKEVKKLYFKNRKSPTTISINENEGDLETTNNVPSQAQKIPNFGSGVGQTNRVMIKGSANFSSIDDIPAQDLGAFLEEDDFDNGIIDTSTLLVFTENIQTIKGTGIIGDGANGSSRTGFGDHDYYAISLEFGQTATFKVTSNDPENPIAPGLVIFDEDGFPVESQLIEGAVSVEATFTASNTGTYYLSIADFDSYIEEGFGFGGPGIIFDAFSAQFRGGVGAEGPYSFEATFIGELDSDFYAVDLKKGDVFGLAANGSALIAEFFTPDGVLANGTGSAPATSILEESPLPVNGDIVLSYIAPRDGTYTFRTIGNILGYEIEAVASRPGTEKPFGKTQLIYLDFTGEGTTLRPYVSLPPGVDPNIPELDIVRNLSPFEDFLERWGIENTYRNRTELTREITKVVNENLKKDIRMSRLNPNFKVRIISDYGHPVLGARINRFLDRFKVPFSRVIIGGTIEEFLIETIGIATTIDPGNFSLDDEAVVLLDLLSNPLVLDDDEDDDDFDIIDDFSLKSGFLGNDPNTINSIPLADGATIEDAVATTVGNIVSHEIGHFIGNFHTDIDNNDVYSIMDSGGLPITFAAGVFPGGLFGDANTVDVDFVEDNYFAREGFNFSARNLTNLNVAFALSRRKFKGFYFGKSQQSNELEDLENEILAMEDEILAGIPKPDVFTDISSWPNPQRKSELSKLRFMSAKEGNAVVSLYNLNGKMVAELFNGNIAAEEVKEIELLPSKYNLAPGMYIYNISTSAGLENHKILITH